MKLETVLLAAKSTIGQANTPTGIVKLPASGKVAVSNLGLTGDFQADSRVHGGLDKAVYQYPFENYHSLIEALPHLKLKFSQPCVGENFSSTGMEDGSVFIGDIYQIGTAKLQVSQPRMPCWKVNHHVGNAHMMSLMIALNRTGWYYRVIEEGDVEAGDSFELVERVQDEFSVESVWSKWVELRENKQARVDRFEIEGLSNEWTFDWG
ncbi:MAG: MOSC domain-containing protein [Pseudomonadota bacterium]